MRSRDLNSQLTAALSSGRAWTLSIFVRLCLFSSALTQTVELYDSMGLTSVLYILLHVLGGSPHIGPTTLLHCTSAAVTFCVSLSMCVL